MVIIIIITIFTISGEQVFKRVWPAWQQILGWQKDAPAGCPRNMGWGWCEIMMIKRSISRIMAVMMVVVMRMMILMIILVTMMISIVQYHVNLTALSLVVVLLWKGMFCRLDLFLFLHRSFTIFILDSTSQSFFLFNFVSFFCFWSLICNFLLCSIWKISSMPISTYHFFLFATIFMMWPFQAYNGSKLKRKTL